MSLVLADYLGTSDKSANAPKQVDYASLSGQDFAKAVLASIEFRQYVVNGLTLGELPPAVVTRLMDHGWGKPPDKIEFEDKTKKLELMSTEELRAHLAGLLTKLGGTE
jgi:hypothetical protein